jgi:Prolyl oligopeptidase family
VGDFHPPPRRHRTSIRHHYFCAHPGPRSQARIGLGLETRFFTSRGYAVADVDYRGSTGYGRFFREALIHEGVVDAEDCARGCPASRWRWSREPKSDGHLWARAPEVTPELRALATVDDFVAAICVSAIVDLEQYRQRTHKFQRHETELLIGPFAHEGSSTINALRQVSSALWPASSPPCSDPPPGPPARPHPWPSVIPAGRAGVGGGGGDLQVTVVDPTVVVEVFDDTAREYGRWRPEGVSGIVIPGHREVT